MTEYIPKARDQGLQIILIWHKKIVREVLGENVKSIKFALPYIVISPSSVSVAINY